MRKKCDRRGRSVPSPSELLRQGLECGVFDDAPEYKQAVDEYFMEVDLVRVLEGDIRRNFEYAFEMSGGSLKQGTCYVGSAAQIGQLKLIAIMFAEQYCKLKKKNGEADE